MKEEQIFYVDIPKLPEEQIEAVEWQSVNTFLTREEAVAFVQNHFDPSSKELLHERLKDQLSNNWKIINYE